MLRLKNRNDGGTEPAGGAPADGKGEGKGGGKGSGWIVFGAVIVVACCAGPALLASLGAGVLAAALGSSLRLGAIAIVLLAVLATGAVAFLVRRRKR